jgi:hypothetical protein
MAAHPFTATASPLLRAISLHQPYASAIAWLLKGYETRGWATHWRGELAICAGLSQERQAVIGASAAMREHLAVERVTSLPLGCVVAVVDLVGCHRTEDLVEQISACERLFGDWSPGRRAWELQQVRVPTITVPVRGRQGLFYLSAEQTALVRAHLVPATARTVPPATILQGDVVEAAS